MTAIRQPFTPQEREIRVQAILSQPPTASHAAVMRTTGYDRETIRRVRLGTLWADVLPHLERMSPEAAPIRCNRCVHWERRSSHAGDIGTCGLGIPEPEIEGQTWARGCGAFTQAA